jgi:hypothetical protein
LLHAAQLGKYNPGERVTRVWQKQVL